MPDDLESSRKPAAENRERAIKGLIASVWKWNEPPDSEPRRLKLGFLLTKDVPDPNDLFAVLESVLALKLRLEEIENGPEDANYRARAIRKELLDFSFMAQRDTQSFRDGVGWLRRVMDGETAEDALGTIAEAQNREVDAVRKSVERFFADQLRMPPPMPIPQLRE